jgi:hypothetical protein
MPASHPVQSLAPGRHPKPYPNPAVRVTGGRSSKRSNSPAVSVRFGHRPEAGCINVTECPQLNRHQLGEPHR